jgi:hypothetical protein
VEDHPNPGGRRLADASQREAYERASRGAVLHQLARIRNKQSRCTSSFLERDLRLLYQIKNQIRWKGEPGKPSSSLIDDDDDDDDYQREVHRKRDSEVFRALTQSPSASRSSGNYCPVSHRGSLNLKKSPVQCGLANRWTAVMPSFRQAPPIRMYCTGIVVNLPYQRSSSDRCCWISGRSQRWRRL